MGGYTLRFLTNKYFFREACKEAYLRGKNTKHEIHTGQGASPAQTIKGSEYMAYTSLNLTALENRIIVELLKGNTENEIASIVGVTEELITGRRNKILDILCGGLSCG